RPAHTRLEHRLRQSEKRISNGRKQNDQCDAKQPRAQQIVERQREKIETERLPEDWIVRCAWWLIEIERELPPAIFQVKAVNQAKDGGHDPAQRPDKPGRRKLKRLVVEINGPALERVGAKQSLEEKKNCAEQERRDQRRTDKQQRFRFEDVPVNLGVTKRAEPERGKVNRGNSRQREKQQ